MKNKKTDQRAWIRIVALVLAALMVIGVIFTAATALAEEAPGDRYELKLDVMLEEQTVRVSQTLDYTNRTGQTLDGMMFCVYANVFRRQTAAPVESDRLDDAFPEGYAPGGIDFMNIEVNGERAEWGVQGDDELFLRVECRMEPGETARFTFEYYLLLPVYSGAMGVGDLGWRLTNFYPVAAVWDEYRSDFPLNTYTAMNEPLVSEAADYFVTLSLPDTYALAAPGTVTATPDGNGMVAYEIRAESIRELALIFSRKMFESVGQTPSGTTVRALANTASAAERIQATAEAALGWLEEALGAYPWPCLTLTETDYLYDGLSYPGVIQLSREAAGGETSEREIVEMCAAQYFSGVVGSDRNASPWLSDALCSMTALMYFEQKNGYDDFIRRLNAQVLPSLQITVPGGVTVDSASERFTSRMEYEIVVVDRGTAVLYEMRRTMGEDVFLQALRTYVERNRMDVATASDFLSAMNEASGERWDEYLYGQMHTIDDYVGMGLEWFE